MCTNNLLRNIFAGMLRTACNDIFVPHNTRGHKPHFGILRESKNKLLYAIIIIKYASFKNINYNSGLGRCLFETQESSIQVLF